MIKNLKTAFSVLVRPKEAFTRLEQGHVAVWITAMTVISLVLIIKPVVTAPAMQAEGQKAIKAELTRMETEEAKGNIPPMPAREKAQMKAAMKTGTSSALIMVSGVFQAIALWLGAALSALIIMGLTKLLKGALAYTSALAVVGLAFMPFFVGETIKTAAAALTGTVGMSEGMSSLIQAPPGTSGPAPFIPGPGYMLASLTLSRIDIFVIWSLVLLALGVMTVGGLQGQGGRAGGRLLDFGLGDCCGPRGHRHSDFSTDGRWRRFVRSMTSRILKAGASDTTWYNG